MALRKAQQAQLTVINDTAKILVTAGLPAEQVLISLKDKIEQFESDSGYKLKLVEEKEDGTQFDLINTKRDFMRVRKSGDTGKVLRAKVYGIPVTITFAKEGEFSFANKEVAEVLEEISGRLRNVTEEIVDLEEVDLLREPELMGEDAASELTEGDEVEEELDDDEGVDDELSEVAEDEE